MPCSGQSPAGFARRFLPLMADVRPAGMFDRFKHRDWRPEVIPDLNGAFGNLNVAICNFPCLVDTSSGRRKYRYSNFGLEFLTELTERQLGDFEHLSALLNAGGTKTAYVLLGDLGAIEVRLTGRPAVRATQFYSDLADALTAAFESKQIKS